MKSSSRVLAALVSAALAFSISACGGAGPSDASREEKGDLSATPTAQVTTTPAADAEIIKITLDGKSVDPSAARFKISLKQPVVLQISASQAGQLHVHSTPEHTIDFGKGDSEITLTFDAPGVIDVEDHALDKLIAQLEVS